MVFLLPKICSAYDLAEVLIIHMGEGVLKCVSRFIFVSVRIGGSDGIE